MYKVSKFGDYEITETTETIPAHSSRYIVFETLEQAQNNVLERAEHKVFEAEKLVSIYKNELLNLKEKFYGKKV